METSESTTTSLNDLPNELLEKIFSFLRLNSSVVYLNDKGEQRVLNQVMVLLHVSRKFRFVALSSRLWHDHDLDFGKLVPAVLSNSHASKELRLSGLFFAVFADDVAVRNLSRKVEWTFTEGPEIVSAVMAAIPSFLSVARRVVLSVPEPTVPLRRLQYCRSLTHLEISGPYRCLDIEGIEGFNSLRHLSLELPELTFHGTLENVTQLESYKLMLSSSRQDTVQLCNGALPTKSADTLTQLTLVGPANEGFSLKAFTNVQTLVYEIDSFEGEEEVYLKVLESLSSHPRSLDIEFLVYSDELPDIKESLHYQSTLMSCACLSALNSLTLRIVWWGWKYTSSLYVSLCMDIVKEMTLRLPNLSKIELSAGLDVSKVECLKGMIQLEFLVWNVPEECLHGCSEGSDPASRLSEEFRSVGLHPEIVVHQNSWDASIHRL